MMSIKDKEALLMASGFIHRAIAVPYAAERVATTAMKEIDTLRTQLKASQARVRKAQEQLKERDRLIREFTSNVRRFGYTHHSHKPLIEALFAAVEEK